MTEEKTKLDRLGGGWSRWLAALAVVLFMVPIGIYAALQQAGAIDGKTHVRYMAWGTPEQQDVERGIIKNFEAEYPDIAIDYMPLPYGQYFQKLQIMLASHTEGDVTRCDLFYYPGYVKMGYFRPLNDLMEEDKSFS